MTGPRVRLATIAVAATVTGGAATAQPPVPIDLPAARLGRALSVLSRQTGDDIGTADPVLPLLATPPLRGRFTVRAALTRLLEGSHAVAIQVGEHSWRIAPRPAAPRRSERVPAAAAVAPTIADIVVTGTKRGVPLADYAGTAAVLELDRPARAGAPAGSEAIEHRLSSVAATQFGPGRDKLFVRGIADSGFTGASQSTTGQYLNDTRLTYNAPDPNLRLYDIARVEILEGPQGTLYGAGALGGVIRVVTVRQALDRWSARGSAGVALTAGSGPGGDIAGVVNVPLVRGAVALRVVGYAMDEGGYIDDPVAARRDINRVRTSGARLGLRTIAGDWTIDLGGAWQGIHGADSQWILGRDFTRDGPPLGYRSDYRLGDVAFSRRWGDLALVSTLSASHQYLLERYDATQEGGAPTTARQTNDIDLFASETRLSRQSADGTGWLAGISLLHNRSVLDRLTLDSAGRTTPHQFAISRVTEETAFAEGSVRVPGGLLATFGARLTHARIRSRATAYDEAATIPIGRPVRSKGGQTTVRAVPTIALSGHPADGVLLFARLQQGFRPGGFGISDNRARRFEGDRITAIEAGTRVGDDAARLQFAATLSYADWRDILAEVVTLSGDPITENIGDGRIAAVEARATWRPTRRMTIEGGLFVNHSRLRRPAYASVAVGHGALPYVAPVGAQAAVDYGAPIGDATLDLSASGRYVGRSRVGAGPALDAVQGGYIASELLATLTLGARAVSLALSNPLNARGNRFALATPYRIHDAQATPLRPRTVRLGMDWRF